MSAGKIASVIVVLLVTIVATAIRTLMHDGAPANAAWIFAVSVAGAAAAVLLPIGFIVDRALLGLERRIQQQVEAAGNDVQGQAGTTRFPKWLQPIGRALTGAVAHFQQCQQAMRAQMNELEIRQRVAESRRRQTEAVLHALRDGVLVIDAFDELLMANEAAAETLGFNLEICRRGDQQPLAEVVQHERLRQIIRDVRNSMDFTNARHVELDIGSRTFDVGFMCVENHKHEVSGVVTIMHDLTREREVSQMKSDFVSKASHELRTPLSSIRAYVEMLVDGEAADEQSRLEFYRIIQGETERLGRLIDNMLNISRIEAGIVPIQREQVDVRPLIERALDTLGPAAAEKKITLSSFDLKMTGSEPTAPGTRNSETLARPPMAANSLCVEGDADMLYQVVLNLVSNAVKYTPEGGRVMVNADAEGMDSRQPTADRRQPSVVVSVTDTGLGIPDDAKPKLFDKFFRIESHKRMASGTGLGLSLCKHIVETVHRGQIGVESKAGSGSKFWFSIPMKYAGRKAA